MKLRIRLTPRLSMTSNNRNCVESVAIGSTGPQERGRVIQTALQINSREYQHLRRVQVSRQSQSVQNAKMAVQSNSQI